MIEFQTARVDDVLALEEQWRAANGNRSGMALRIAKDLDRHDRYVWIVEFRSYEEAMRSDVLQEIELASRTEAPDVASAASV